MEDAVCSTETRKPCAMRLFLQVKSAVPLLLRDSHEAGILVVF